MIERLSIELSNRCRKACAFCYSTSTPDGATRWTADDVIALVRDCARHGAKAVSFGGGEPLEAPALLWPVLTALRGVVFRSFTTSGLDLDAAFHDVVAAAPDKVHVSIHHPGARAEVDRVVAQVTRLARAGVASGVNLLVARSQLAAARATAQALHAAGIDNTRIVYLPMRGRTAETPTPDELAVVAGGRRFQSMTCLTACAPSPRFVAVAWDRTIAHCSYTTARRPLAAAHSMDTTWFAVDRDGHVAVFDSGEAGAVPIDGYTDDFAPILDELVKAAGGKELDWDELPERLAELGIFFYTHEEWENALAGPYERRGTPAQPMPGHQVPRGLRAHMVSFDGRFAETDQLQPLEHWKSEAWSAAWIATDGVSVHCVPGHEEEYAAEVEELASVYEGERKLQVDPPGGPSEAVQPAARVISPRRWWQFWRK